MFEATKHFVSSWNTKFSHGSSPDTIHKDVESKGVGDAAKENDDFKFPDLANTISSAKDWTSNLYKKVTLSGESTAKSLLEKAKSVDIKSKIDKIPLWHEIEQYQKEFASQLSGDTSKLSSDQCALPWDPEVSGLTDATANEALKTRILSLSEQPNTFLLPPPAEAELDMKSVVDLQLATALLEVDENLATMRYNLVPGKISETTFWRNYFYRLSQVRRSAQLAAMAGGCSGDESSASSTDFVCVSKTSVPDAGQPTKQAADSKPVDTKRRNKKSAAGEKRTGERENAMASEPEAAQVPAKSDEEDFELDDELEKELAREIDELDLQTTGDDEIDEELERELLKQ